MPENVDAVNAWLVVQTQMTRRGLRYEGVRAALAMARVPSDPALFEGLQTMEHAVLALMAERNG